MKKTIILIFLLVFFIPAFSQVQFEVISFEQALMKARETGKLLFLQFESPTCDQCNEVADKAFEDKKLGSQLKQGFICVKIGQGIPIEIALQTSTIKRIFSAHYF